MSNTVKRGFNNSITKKPRFSDEMKKHLKNNYGKMTLSELAEHYGVTEKQVKYQAQRQYLTMK